MSKKSKPIPKVTRPEQFEIYPRKTNTPGALDLGDGKQLKLGRSVTITKDKGLAEAVNQRYGLNRATRGTGDVLVVPVSNNHLHEDPHGVRRTFTFQMPAMPWHEYDALGRRIK